MTCPHQALDQVSITLEDHLALVQLVARFYVKMFFLSLLVDLTTEKLSKKKI